MSEYLASKADKEEVKSSLAKADAEGWTTVSRRSVRGRLANTAGTLESSNRIAVKYHFPFIFR